MSIRVRRLQPPARAFFWDAVRTIVPARDDPHGPLPPILLTLTAVTGVVDAVSFLRLDHVFVANMTGNTVFVGFGLAGAAELSIAASLVAIAAFLLGAAAAGGVAARVAHRGRLLAVGTSAESVLVAAALVVSAFVTVSESHPQYALIVLLAIAMGIQNVLALRLAVPNLRITVLTLTLAGLAADSAGGVRSQPGRRVVAVLTMFVGALVGGLLTLHVGVSAALAPALVLTAGVAAAGYVLSRGEPAWARLPK